MLDINNITYRIAGRTLFDQASLSIPSGHHIGLVGPNGTGKSTLFKLIANELDMLNVTYLNANLSDAEQSANLCGGTAFAQALPKLTSISSSSSLIAGILVRPCMDDDTAGQDIDKSRPNTCPHVNNGSR